MRRTALNLRLLHSALPQLGVRSSCPRSQGGAGRIAEPSVPVASRVTSSSTATPSRSCTRGAWRPRRGAEGAEQRARPSALSPISVSYPSNSPCTAARDFCHPDERIALAQFYWPSFSGLSGAVLTTLARVWSVATLIMLIVSLTPRHRHRVTKKSIGAQLCRAPKRVQYP